MDTRKESDDRSIPTSDSQRRKSTIIRGSEFVNITDLLLCQGFFLAPSAA
jgi:hypothetical protein